MNIQQASETNHSKSSLGNFHHQYLAELLFNVYSHSLVVKSMSCCSVRGSQLFSDSITYCAKFNITLIILTQIVLNANKKNKLVFSCFVYLVKSCDGVNIELLWLKLSHVSLSSNIYYIIILQSIYSNANSVFYSNNLYILQTFSTLKGCASRM